MVNMGRYTSRDSKRQDDLFGGEVHGNGEREAVVYDRHLFVPARNELTLHVRLGLFDPLGVQCT